MQQKSEEMLSHPVVTVVIPCYNHARFVEASIRSVLSQTYSPIELLVFDDGSTDDSRAIIGRLADEHKFFFRCNANQGLTKTLNEALSMASGRYFSMLSSDDHVTPGKIQKQVEFMESRPDVAFCGGSHIEIDEQDQPVAKQRRLPANEIDFDDLFLQRKPGPSPVSMFARTEMLRAVGGYDESIRLEDIDIWLKVTHAGGKIVCLDEVFGYYRKHGNNTYKRTRFMYESLMASYAKYQDHPRYPEVVSELKKSTLLKAARNDAVFARELLSAIPWREVDGKVVRGALRYLKLLLTSRGGINRQ